MAGEVNFGLFLTVEVKYNKERQGACKYEQIVNSTENPSKIVVFRIFRQILAKTNPEAQCLCGFPEGTVEMKEARLGH